MGSVCVIIPAFNVADHIGEAIGSALRQVPPPDQLIVVDDGSTDRTAEIAGGFGPGVLVLRQQNRGAAAARNAGMKACSTDNVAFLDADDAFLPGRLSELVPVLDSSPPEIAFVWSDEVRWDGREGRGLLNPPHIKRLGHRLGIDAFLDDNLVSTHIVARRAALEHVGGWDESLRMSEDYDLFFRLLGAGYRYTYVTHATYLYRMSGSLSSDATRWLPIQRAVCEKALRELSLTRRQRRLLRYNLARAKLWLRLEESRRLRRDRKFLQALARLAAAVPHAVARIGLRPITVSYRTLHALMRGVRLVA